ncbi:lipopolysaccharide biosynthesis protein [Aureimonas glaciei]|uniref:Succinoglycan biosynthesis transport protein ExoT n=1 Tax=Aureimonas glaciei TaxID=1776957 RepID=A0A916Y0M9_9HYPH|nr:lipopolysaccharide biosynthesis protein [Aureimonas glaciei]GGD24073.1 succinoglycan biosynthesis transport protein ExoT [Aureimonas glaciei]
MTSRVNINSVTNNVGWSVLSRIGTFGLKFLTVPILARLLSPEEFGVVAVALTIVQFLATIGSAGLAAALILQKDEDMETVHSVFWANFVISVVMMVMIILWADGIAALLGSVEASALLQVFALLIPLQLCGDVAYSLLARRMSFGKDAAWSVTSETLGVVAAVGLALLGWTIGALVAQQFVSAIIRFVGLYWAAGYRPRFVVSLPKLKGLTNFSLGLMGSEIANFVTFQSPQVVVARVLGLGDAGAYSIANRFSSIPNQIMLTGLMGVLFPAFSQMMHDRERRAAALMLATQVSTLLIAPMMFGLWAVAEPAMTVIFGEKWAFAWPVLGLLAVSKGIMSPCGTFIPYLKGAGHSGTLWWSAVIRAVLVTGMVTYGAVYEGLVGAMAWLCIANALTLVGYSWAVLRTNDGSFFRDFAVMCRPMLVAVVMAIAVRFLLDQVKADIPSDVLRVFLGMAVGGVLYGVMVLLTERPLIMKLLALVMKRRAAPVVA